MQIRPNDIMEVGARVHVPVSVAESKVSKRFDVIPSATLYPNADEIEYLQRLVKYKVCLVHKNELFLSVIQNDVGTYCYGFLFVLAFSVIFCFTIPPTHGHGEGATKLLSSTESPINPSFFLPLKRKMMKTSYESF